jgi:DNA-binding IclR family transcriptional regulator
MRKSDFGLSTVKTAFAILEYIGEKGSVLPAEIAGDLKLVRANVHRLLYTLETAAYVEKTERGAYHLTFTLFELGNTVPHSRNLIDSSRPAMLRLAQATGETVNNGVLFETEVLYIDKVEAATHLKLDRNIGSTDPLHCTSLGKVLLAFQDEDTRRDLLIRLPLERRTEHSIAEIPRLEVELEKIRERGYALDLQELSCELHCVAAPVFDEEGRLRSAISISAPSNRFGKERLREIAPDLLATTGAIGRALSSPD